MRILAWPVALGMILYLSVAPQGGSAGPLPKGPPLSSTGLLSAFAQENGLAEPPIATQLVGLTGEEREPAVGVASVVPPNNVKVNQDFSLRPQNETTIAVNPFSPNMLVGGANDYRLGNPVGAAFYTTFDEGATWNDGFPPFPLLTGTTKGQKQIHESPFGTGDPVVAFGRARSVPGGPVPGSTVVYFAYLGVSASFCEHGIFVSRSSNGLLWTRPVAPPLLPPGGLYTPVYWDKADDCTVFNDKPWLAVDNTGGPHDGRVYVTWSRFYFNRRETFKESSIQMAFSDDNGQTWSQPLEVNGYSRELCGAQVNGGPGRCDESQFSHVVVGKDGKVRIAFLNQQYRGAADGFRNQYLMTTVDPDSLAVSGPYKVADMIDGDGDIPFASSGKPTLCNSNFRYNSAGNMASDPSDPAGLTLYLVFADNRNGSSFSPWTQVSQQPPDSFACPNDLYTDTDIFIMKSMDGGVTWTNPSDASASALRVNQDPLLNAKDQWFPYVAVGPSGRIDVVFYDRREDPFNRFASVFLARSQDGGATWSDQKVSSVHSNMNWAFEGGLFIGDYNAMTIGPDGTSYPFWTDARSGTPGVRQTDVYMGVVPP